MAKKIYVLDTSVCLTDSDCVFHFGNNDIIIPCSAELDNEMYNESI